MFFFYLAFTRPLTFLRAKSDFHPRKPPLSSEQTRTFLNPSAQTYFYWVHSVRKSYQSVAAATDSCQKKEFFSICELCCGVCCIALVAVGEDAEDCETEHIKEYDKADELYYEIEYRHQNLAYYFHIVVY